MPSKAILFLCYQTVICHFFTFSVLVCYSFTGHFIFHQIQTTKGGVCFRLSFVSCSTHTHPSCALETLRNVQVEGENFFLFYRQERNIKVNQTILSRIIIGMSESEEFKTSVFWFMVSAYSHHLTIHSLSWKMRMIFLRGPLYLSF